MQRKGNMSLHIIKECANGRLQAAARPHLLQEFLQSVRAELFDITRDRQCLRRQRSREAGVRSHTQCQIGHPHTPKALPDWSSRRHDAVFIHSFLQGGSSTRPREQRIDGEVTRSATPASGITAAFSQQALGFLVEMGAHEQQHPA